jgi:hypothetical protein
LRWNSDNDDGEIQLWFLSFPGGSFALFCWPTALARDDVFDADIAKYKEPWFFHEAKFSPLTDS